jgi:hypothetical protein
MEKAAGSLAAGLPRCSRAGQTTLTAVPGFGSIKHVRIGGLIAKRWPVVLGFLLAAALGWAD